MARKPGLHGLVGGDQAGESGWGCTREGIYRATMFLEKQS